MKIKNSYAIERIGDASELLFPDPVMKIAWSEIEKRGIIYYALQETFIDALHFAQDKLATEELLNHFDDGQYVIKRDNLFFIALMKKDRITFFTIENDSIVMFYSDMKEEKQYWLSNQIERNNTQSKPGQIIIAFKNWIITLLNFIKFADVETKFIKAKSKLDVSRKDGKVVNDSNQDYILLNSTWFTNIVRTEGFLVRGHFRLQPYKNSKKLIYIDTYEKHGYNLNAKITNTK